MWLVPEAAPRQQDTERPRNPREPRSLPGPYISIRPQPRCAFYESVRVSCGVKNTRRRKKQSRRCRTGTELVGGFLRLIKQISEAILSNQAGKG